MGTDRTDAGIIVLFDPRRGDGGTRSGAEEAVGWGWDPPEETRPAIFATLTPDGGYAPVAGRFFDEYRKQDTSRRAMRRMGGGSSVSHELSPEEREILEAFENGELIPVHDAQHQLELARQTARNTLEMIEVRR